MNSEGLIILAEIARPLAEVDRETYLSELKDLEETVLHAKDNDAKARAEKARDGIASIIEVLDREVA